MCSAGSHSRIFLLFLSCPLHTESIFALPVTSPGPTLHMMSMSNGLSNFQSFNLRETIDLSNLAQCKESRGRKRGERVTLNSNELGI